MLVGVLGAGQLGQMLAVAGAQLDLTFRFLDPHEAPCAASFGEHVRADYTDAEALDRFADGLSVATLEFENVDPTAVAHVARTVSVHPGTRSLETAKDRAKEKSLFASCGIPAADTATIDTLDDLERAVASIGAPGILKARTGGYDGKGQSRIKDPGDARTAFDELDGRPCVYERFVEFDHEVSIICARSATGETCFYPLVVNTHEQGILIRTDVPRSPHPLTREAIQHATRVLETLDHVGVLTIEFFATSEGLIANELAPRVHNSGHWTIDGAATSQFENHLRAILGWPLGPVDPISPGCVMLNCIGSLPDSDTARELPGVALHEYGKSPRPGRKIGHATWTGDDPADLETLVELVTSQNQLV